MRIALFGASGTIGRRIALEALQRGHHVTGIVRDPSRVDSSDERFQAVKGDARDPASVASVARGHDVIISAIGPKGSTPSALVEAARALVDGAKRAGIGRLIVVGGAGSLDVRPGIQLLDTPEFNEAWKPVARAHRDALEVYRTADLDWTFVCPAEVIKPGERTGRYRTGTDQLLRDNSGNSFISAEDYAVALIDELERPTNVRRRTTVAY